MYMDTMLRLLKVDQIVDGRVTRALERCEQIDDLGHWYDSFNPLPMMQELADQQLKLAVHMTAEAKMTKEEYSSFCYQWNQLEPDQQRRYLCDLAGLPDPSRDRDFDPLF